VSHATGTRVVEATLDRDDQPRLFHLTCFVAFNTGTRREDAIWTYRIVPARPN
jgi:hypothetical protein